ncbi:MAG: hypothetical protein Kow00121_21710 [Elainellaceae cyanobacterium]
MQQAKPLQKHRYLKPLSLLAGLTASLISGSGLGATIALAQIQPDSSLGNERSTVRPREDASLLIEGGAQRGRNLLHSFSEFNVRANQRIYFANPEGIARIFSRVTGGNPSHIRGLLGVAGAADLFLLNPNGIIFGENARLDVRGSFVASTADSVLFANEGFAFSAVAPEVPPLLTVSVPTGLQFGNNPGAIVNRSYVNVPESQVGPPNSTADPAIGLAVSAERTLALVGGQLRFPGGELTAPGGRIELGSVISPDQVRLIPVENGWGMHYNRVQTFGDIQLSGLADVDASGVGGGTIQLRGDQITVADRSLVRANTLGDQDGGAISVLAARQLRLVGGGQITASTRSTGDGGSINVAAPLVELIGVARFENGQPVTGIAPSGVILPQPSTLSAFANEQAQGRAGSVTVTARQLRLQEGATIQTSTWSSGNAGNVEINAAESIEISGIVQELGTPSAIVAFSGGIPDTDLILSRDATGRGGDLFITTDQLVIRDRALIATGSVNSTQEVRAGNIEIDAQVLGLTNRASLLSNTNSGDGGNIALQLGSALILRQESNLSTSSGITQAAGNGGDITISTDFILTAPSENSNIAANAFTGSGGEIRINAQGILGIAEQERPTSDSDITATSEQGVNGEIIISSPDIDPTSGLADLPDAPTNAELAQGCQIEGGVATAEFFNSGRGGVPVSPYEPLGNSNILEDVRLPAYANSAEGASTVPDRPIEAQGWVIDDRGTVVLLAASPANQTTVECHLY